MNKIVWWLWDDDRLAPLLQIAARATPRASYRNRWAWLFGCRIKTNHKAAIG